MPCKHCHKSKETKSKMIIFEEGKRYKINGNEYICAQVDANKYALINLQNGNRWSSPIKSNIQDVLGENVHPSVVVSEIRAKK